MQATRTLPTRSPKQGTIRRAQIDAAEGASRDIMPGVGMFLQRTVGNQALATIQRRHTDSAGGFALPANHESTLRSQRGGGKNLPPHIQSHMQDAFGADFGQVRIHEGAPAHQLNRAMSADAFTSGRDIFFRDGAYQPESPQGQHLLAHELTHVVQQGAAPQSGAVQRKPNGQGRPIVQVRARGMEPNRLSLKRTMMHLDFVKMKRADPNAKKFVSKYLPAVAAVFGMRNTTGTLFGHYWTEIGYRNAESGVFRPTKSYGWWPAEEPTIRKTLRGVPGILNEKGGDHDPHENEVAKTSFHPVMEVDPEAETYEQIRARVTQQIETFAKGYKGSWSWRLGWGKNCQTFQKQLKSNVGLHFKTSRHWLNNPNQQDQDLQGIDANDNDQVVSRHRVPDRWQTVFYDQTGDENGVAAFTAHPNMINSGGMVFGATGLMREGTNSQNGEKTVFVQFYVNEQVRWIPASTWQNTFQEAYPGVLQQPEEVNQEGAGETENGDPGNFAQLENEPETPGDVPVNQEQENVAQNGENDENQFMLNLNDEEMTQTPGFQLNNNGQNEENDENPFMLNLNDEEMTQTPGFRMT